MSGYADGSLIPLASPAGQTLLAAATAAGTCTYERLTPYWAPQSGRRRCGARSAAVVLNALAATLAFSEDAWFGGGGGNADSDGGGNVAGEVVIDGGGGGGDGAGGGGDKPPRPLRPAAADVAAAAAASVGLTAAAVDAAGMTLAQLGALLIAVAAATGGGVARPAGVRPPARPLSPACSNGCWPFSSPLFVTVTPAQSPGDDDDGWADWPATLRTAACDADAVLINYCMRTAGQGDHLGGHVAPLGGWEPASDRLLLLDVWPETGPCWVTTAVLAAAAATVDGRSGRMRGMVELRLGR
ncbi:hypothetical protein MMPV_009808 [Pyropia vietnamensis]